MRPRTAGFAPNCRVPEVVSENHDGVASGHLILFGSERASELRLDAHHREEIPGHQHADGQPRRRAALGGESDDWIDKRNQPFEAPGAIANIEKVAIGGALDSSAGRGRGKADRQDFGRMRHRQRPQQQRIGEAEHRAVGADANRQRQDGDEGEPRISGEHAPAVLEILPDAARKLEQPAPAFTARGFLREQDVAEVFQRGQSGGVTILAAGDAILCRHGQVAGDLFFELAIRMTPLRQPVPERHTLLQAGFTI